MPVTSPPVVQSWDSCHACTESTCGSVLGLKIHNDIIDNMDNDKVLTLLDLSAAFDTIDHLILLQHPFGWNQVS